MVGGQEATPGDAKATARLRTYWTNGEGAGKIGWGSPGDFDRCVVQLGKYVSDPDGLCAEYHHEALGIWPATHAALDRAGHGDIKPKR
ncbi:hypothetical protein D5S18_18570 [Nocardia panacis]|uniref:Uncharacterized protein n=1 Tax=Nocardia panacis TaxID=2340916 RepID=A0A3A4K644_9NOCA|nr:hypothetical protein [Nocardia panacis]RJO74158.1 hypothetical protein D5S18_18570 [Nocardia panacis]